MRLKDKAPADQVKDIKYIEQCIANQYKYNEIKTPIHLCIGQEHIPVAVCSALTDQDILIAYYRSHGWYLAKGGDIHRFTDELMGLETGCSGGKGGSMHLIDMSVNFYGTTAIVGGQFSHAVGAALALNLKEVTERIVVCAFGDGATEQGVFMEALMFSQLHRLPILWLCVNDRMASQTPIEIRQYAFAPPYLRAEACGVLSQVIQNKSIKLDVLIPEVNKSVQSVRSHRGPLFLEIASERLCDHVGPKQWAPNDSGDVCPS